MAHIIRICDRPAGVMYVAGAYLESAPCNLAMREINHVMGIKSVYTFATKLTKIYECAGHHFCGICLACGNRFPVGGIEHDISSMIHLSSHIGLFVYVVGDKLACYLEDTGGVKITFSIGKLLSLFAQFITVNSGREQIRNFIRNSVVRESNVSFLDGVPTRRIYGDLDGNASIIADEITKNTTITWECMLCKRPYDCFPDSLLVASHLAVCDRQY